MAILDDFPAYFWYGIHAADVLFSYMGRGCETVEAVHAENMDVLVGTWNDGRIGSVRGSRLPDAKFGCVLQSTEGTKSGVADDDPPCFAMLMKQVVPFFQTGVAPIDLAETVEIVAFLEAAEKSWKNGGKPEPLGV